MMDISIRCQNFLVYVAYVRISFEYHFKRYTIPEYYSTTVYSSLLYNEY